MNDQDHNKDLDYLLKNMQPVLDNQDLVFCSLPSNQAEEYLSICQGYYAEKEGTTIIIGKDLADLHQLNYEFIFKRISLEVYSSLEAVGFLARITEVLAAQGFSVNVISAYYHDYLFVKADQAQAALETLLLWQDKLADEN
jgi:hypothetical protein